MSGFAPGARNSYSGRRAVAEQHSPLLPSLFEHLDEERCLTILDAGPALQDTVDFLSGYRCRLQVLDLFSEMPLARPGEGEAPLVEQMGRLIQIPEGMVFDVCLFWDVFNYMDRDQVLAFFTLLRPHLRPGGMAHCFGVHKQNMEQDNRVYAVGSEDMLRVRQRTVPLPGYAPHSQSKLKNLLFDFHVDRTMLLADGRLELLLRVRN